MPFGTPQQSQNDSSTGFGSIIPKADGSANNDKAKKILEELEKKKKKLLEKRKKLEAAKAESNSAATSLNPSAAPFAPSRNSSPMPEGSDSLAERNAARFDTSAANAATRAHLPSDLKAKAGQAVDYAALRSSGGDREVLDQAKSLVGTCPYMCPDEELLRREREGDIQLLELVRPGELHPQHWTLRDTAIKRFRRSAADYKLDVPEWVRPPDVLEKVCSYLEEWIMVSLLR